MALSKLDQIRQTRLDKLASLRQGNIDPYPQPNLAKRHSCATAPTLKTKLTLAGRLISMRGHGKVFFADLQDQSGQIQLFFQQANLKNFSQLTKLIDIGDIITVQGKIFKTKSGQTSVDVSSFQLLSKAIRPLPEKYHGFKDVEERYRQRYLDLIVNSEVKQIFQTRSKILTKLRSFLDNHQFLEVETPILQPIYGGASAKPFVTHHNNLDMDMYLRISDELYLKRLIVGGFEKVYEVSRDFRNEGVSRFHNPEFTQVEFYWAYVDYQELMDFTEKLIVEIIKHVKGQLSFSYQGKALDFTPPFPRVTFNQAILEHTGVDINQIDSPQKFNQVLSQKKLTVDLEGAVGLGAMFDALYKQHVRPKLVGPLFLTDYPSEMIALAKRKADDLSKIASFQLIACGTELLKAYNELNDPVDQSQRWQAEQTLQKQGLETAMQFDHDYIRALEYGMPPTAGWGMGIDRLTQFLTDQPTIKDVILFPSLRNDDISNSKPTGQIVVGKINQIKPHPDADKLQLVLVDIGNQTLEIVCGATNIKVGDLVPVALIGAQVIAEDGSTLIIDKRKIRGIQSNGMLCSCRELGLGTDHSGIYILDSKLIDGLGKTLSL